MNTFVIIAFEDNGAKTPVDMEFTTYNNACIMQEVLETLCPYMGFLIYTADEWMYECENNA